MGKPRKVYRQGDLLLVEEEGVDLRYAMKEGEVLEIVSENGNTHRLKSSVYTIYGRRYVVVESPSILTHPQHPELVIEPGIYRVEFVRDYALNRSID
jgi:hypothetical protein